MRLPAVPDDRSGLFALDWGRDGGRNGSGGWLAVERDHDVAFAVRYCVDRDPVVDCPKVREGRVAE